MKKLIYLLALTTLGQQLGAETIRYTWDTLDEVTQFKSITVKSQPEHAAGAGIGASGALTFKDGSYGSGEITLTSPDSPISFDLSIDQSIKQSTYFKTGSRKEYGASKRRALYLGITNAQSVSLVKSNGLTPEVSALQAGIYVNNYNDDAGEIKASFGLIGQNTFVIQDNQGGFQLKQDAWYYMGVTYTYTASSKKWTVAISVSESDANGAIQSLVTKSELTSAYKHSWGDSVGLKGYIASWGGSVTNISIIDNTNLVATEDTPSYTYL